MNIPTDEECKTCEFNKSIWKSQRGMVIVILAFALMYMWTIYVLAVVKYGVQIDMTTISAITLAVTGGAGWYFYAKGKEETAVIEEKKMEVKK